MKQITLTQGKVALVDDADYEWLSQWSWCALHYRGKCGDTYDAAAVQHFGEFAKLNFPKELAV